MEAIIFSYNALGLLVAEYTDSSSPPPPSGTSYISSDHLGTPRVITNSQGTVVSRHDYMPFGEEITFDTDGA